MFIVTVGMSGELPHSSPRFPVARGVLHCAAIYRYSRQEGKRGGAFLEVVDTLPALSHGAVQRYI